ncbi:MAG: hypothetical protein EXQ85_08530 [Alphaproteobacteria bacterium]|nr:hypothetical protein [Alphaproteobacteria bacterium]
MIRRDGKARRNTRGWWTRAALLGASALALSFAAPGADAQQKTLTIGVGEVTKAKGNAHQGSGTPHIIVWSAIYNSLVEVDQTGTPVPGLAARWQNVDPTTWRFTLRPNVTFHNGRPFDQRAIVDMFAYLATEDGKKYVRGQAVQAATIESVKAIDATTIEFKTRTPQAILPTLLSNFDIPEPQHFAEGGINAMTNQPVGTGAFAVDNWSPQNVTFRKFDKHYAGNPKVDRLVITELAESAARISSLLSGQIDVDVAVGPDDFARIRAAGGTVDAAPGRGVRGITFVSAGQVDGKGATTPWADRRVRMAAIMAVDRKAMIKEILNGEGYEANQAATHGTFGYNPNVPLYPYDPEGAKKLLAEAGQAAGFNVKLWALVTDPISRLIYEKAIGDLGKVGIKAELTGITIAEFLKHFGGGTWLNEGVSVFGNGHQVAPEMDATSSLSKYVSCRKRPEVSIFYCNRDEADLLDAADKEFDSNKRKAILHRLMQLNHDNGSTLLFVEPPELTGLGKRVKGFKNYFLRYNYHEIDVVG